MSKNNIEPLPFELSDDLGGGTEMLEMGETRVVVKKQKYKIPTKKITEKDVSRFLKHLNKLEDVE